LSNLRLTSQKKNGSESTFRAIFSFVHLLSTRYFRHGMWLALHSEINPNVVMNKPKILLDFPAVNLEYLTADSNYTVLHFCSGECLISGYSLKVFEAFFASDSFIRIDRSNLVNSSFISEVSHRAKGVYVRLKNNTELLIPRRRQTELFDQYPNLFINLQNPLQP